MMKPIGDCLVWERRFTTSAERANLVAQGDVWFGAIQG